MTITGKAALDLVEQIKRDNAQRRTDALARARAAAAERGKEPFDLARLGQLTALAAHGRMTPDEQQERFEHMYYVEAPELMTLAELARKLDEVGRW
jgi:hypothetical protein